MGVPVPFLFSSPAEGPTQIDRRCVWNVGTATGSAASLAAKPALSSGLLLDRVGFPAPGTQEEEEVASKMQFPVLAAAKGPQIFK